MSEYAAAFSSCEGTSARIAHLSSVHARGDTRILIKECNTLARAGYDVALVVADGLGDEQRDDVRIFDVGGSRGRLERMTGATRRVAARAMSIDASLYHLHDPELLPLALDLKRRGKRVIYDAHEDLSAQILSKPYLHPALRRPIAGMAAAIERFACRRVDHVVAATRTIRDKFLRQGIPATDVNNFPMLGELETGVDRNATARNVCYIGSISLARGIKETVAALEMCASGARLNLGGRFDQELVKAEIETTAGWAKVNELGFLSRSGVRDVLADSAAGLVLLHPTSAYLEALPVKMFEYMSASLPVVASNFPLWREIVEGNDCGVCVDPLDPQAIARAIDYLLEHPEVARRMGENGRKAVFQHYNWEKEEKKLLEVYGQLLKTPTNRNG